MHNFVDKLCTTGNPLIATACGLSDLRYNELGADRSSFSDPGVSAPGSLLFLDRGKDADVTTVGVLVLADSASFSYSPMPTPRFFGVKKALKYLRTTSI